MSVVSSTPALQALYSFRARVNGDLFHFISIIFPRIGFGILVTAPFQLEKPISWTSMIGLFSTAAVTRLSWEMTRLAT